MQENFELNDFVQEDDFIFDDEDIAKFKARMNTYRESLNHTLFKPEKIKPIKEKPEDVHRLTSGWDFFIR